MSVITVSRQYGSRGEKIARQVAMKLGYDYFDKEILAEVSRTTRRESGVSAVGKPHEETHGLHRFLEELLAWDSPHVSDYPCYPGITLDWSRTLLESQSTPDAVEDTSLFRDVVERLWDRGNIVIVGRGSQMVLGAKPETFHVRIVATLADRCKRVIENESISEGEARRRIQIADAQRAYYLKHDFDVDWNDPELYHLILNNSFVSVARSVDAILAIAGQAKTGTGLTHLMCWGQ